MQEFRESAPRQHVYILRIWETRSEQTDAPAMKKTIAQVRDSVNEGSSFGDALAQHKRAHERE